MIKVKNPKCKHLDTDMDSDELNQLVMLKIASKPPEEEIATGDILNNLTQENDVYRITFGWDVFTAYACDNEWNAFRLRLAAFLDTLPLAERQAEEDKIQSEDGHWKWFNFSVWLKSDEYKWFFFRVNDEVQAACLIYHPKKSILSSQELFYIEFIAVAPWNRYNPLSQKKYSRIGTVFLKEIMKHCKDKLNYQSGMCLHSLPQAQGFYEHKLKMIRCAQADKEGLWYYEMNEDDFLDFVRAG